MLIALAGFAGSGKSEVSRFLTEEMQFTRIKFADPLKNMFRTMLADIGHSAEDIERYVEGDLKSSIIDGLHELGVVSRNFQIDLGTGFGRKLVHPDLWAKLWGGKVDAIAHEVEDIVADDLRFVNEWAENNARSGITVVIQRAGSLPAAFKWKRIGPLLHRWFGIMWGVHDSERVDRILKRADFVIENNGTIEELLDKVRALIETL